MKIKRQTERIVKLRMSPRSKKEELESPIKYCNVIYYPAEWRITAETNEGTYDLQWDIDPKGYFLDRLAVLSKPEIMGLVNAHNSTYAATRHFIDLFWDQILPYIIAHISKYLV